MEDVNWELVEQQLKQLEREEKARRVEHRVEVPRDKTTYWENLRKEFNAVQKEPATELVVKRYKFKFEPPQQKQRKKLLLLKHV